MAKRTTKKTTKPVRPQLGDGVEILNAGSVLEDPITSTLETNYMPYAMSVIVSRAIPLSQLKETGIFESLAKMKYEVPNDGQEKFAEYDAAIEDALRQVNEANR